MMVRPRRLNLQHNTQLICVYVYLCVCVSWCVCLTLDVVKLVVVWGKLGVVWSHAVITIHSRNRVPVIPCTRWPLDQLPVSISLNRKLNGIQGESCRANEIEKNDFEGCAIQCRIKHCLPCYSLFYIPTILSLSLCLCVCTCAGIFE